MIKGSSDGKIVYSQDVLFRGIESTSRHEDVPKEREPEKREF